MATILSQDLTAIDEDDRPEYLEACAGQVASLLEERYPAGDGHNHFRGESQPFEEWPDLTARHVTVRRGTFWGFCVSLVPDDFQVRKMRVELKRVSAFAAAVMIVAAVLGFLVSIGAVICVLTLKSWDPVHMGLAIVSGLPAGLAVYGLLRVLGWPVVRACTDEAALQREESELGGAVTDLLED